MARSKKEKIKVSPEQRLMERWDQQVFFLQKQFPEAKPLISGIRKNHEKLQSKGTARKAAKTASPAQVPTADFVPTEEALKDLTDLYSTLKFESGPASPTVN